MDYCKDCGEREIKHIKRKLCGACYKRLHSKGQLKKIPKHIKKAYAMRKIRTKYGVQFFRDLKAVHFRHFWTFTSVAEKYGLTRERVRQIHNDIYGCGGDIFIRIKAKERSESEALVCRNDPRHKVADYPEGSLIYKGAYYEKKFMNICEQLGFFVEIPCDRVIDIKVNGFWVEVKSSLTPRKTTNSVVKYHHYSIGAKQRNKADFFACYHATQDCFFIVPNSEKLQRNHKGRRSIFIAIHPGVHCNSKNAFYEYRNAFYLLQLPILDTDKDTNKKSTANAAAVMRQPEMAD